MKQLSLELDLGPLLITGGVGRVPEPVPPADLRPQADRVSIEAPPVPEPPRTLADVLVAVNEAPELKPNRRRDLISALRSIARMSRRPLSGLPADPRELRIILEGLHPAAFEMSAKRHANLRCDLARAIDRAHGRKRGGRLCVALTSEWRALRKLCPSPWIEIELHGFMRWCSAQRIVPAAVDDATLAAFVEHRDGRDLKLDIPKLRRQIARAWNQSVEAVPEWPRTRLQHVPARLRWTLAWSEFPAQFREDVDRWTHRLGGADLLDEDAPDKALRPISIKQSRFCVQMAATTLVTSGMQLDELVGLRDLVLPERVAAILNGLRARYGRESHTPYRVATTLRAVAVYDCKLDQKELDRLHRMCKRVKIKRGGMVQKNRDRLLPFRDPTTRDRFLLLPASLMRSAERDGRGRRQSAIMAQMAVALEIAQMAPMRARNLAGIELDRHLTFVGHGRHEYAVITIPEQETKTEIALEYPLTPESTRLIRHYIDQYLPVLSPGEARFLFPGGKGGAKLPATLSQQVEQTIRQGVGHRVNLHLLRHFAAMIYLQAYPGSYEAVRRLLGHATASAALDMYVGFETAAAVGRFDEIILRQRELATARTKVRLGRGGRR